MPPPEPTPDPPTERVSVVVPTRNRPELVRKAIASVVAQDYVGDLEIVVVFDQSEPDATLESDDPHRSVRVVSNTRSQGLSGSRNTGILSVGGNWVAFLDDDDWWRPTKLRRQLEAVATAGRRVDLVSTAIEVEFQGSLQPRTAGFSEVTFSQLLRSRMSMLHSSTFLFRRLGLVEEFGLVNEHVPGSQNEDWDLLLRVSERGPILHVDEPLVVVLWGETSFFTRTWDTKVSSLHWMLEHHPAIYTDRKGLARVYGQIAFGEASRPDRRAALGWAVKTLRADPLQWRALVAGAVAVGAVSPAVVLNTLHRFGRGV